MRHSRFGVLDADQGGRTGIGGHPQAWLRRWRPGWASADPPHERGHARGHEYGGAQQEFQSVGQYRRRGRHLERLLYLAGCRVAAAAALAGRDVQVPAAVRLAAGPDTAQVRGVSERNDTASPDDADAERAAGSPTLAPGGGGGKVIVCC